MTLIHGLIAVMGLLVALLTVGFFAMAYELRAESRRIDALQDALRKSVEVGLEQSANIYANATVMRQSLELLQTVMRGGGVDAPRKEDLC